MTDTPRLVGRSAVVTGASRGIGRRIVELFCEEGARVWALARSEDALGEIAAEYRFPEQRYHLQPILGFSYYEGGSFFAYAGLRYEWTLSDRWYLAPSLSAGGLRTNSVDLGPGGFNFRSAIELGYRINDDSNIALRLYHLSNAGIEERNPGIESLTLSYSADLTGVLGFGEPERERGLLVRR